MLLWVILASHAVILILMDCDVDDKSGRSAGKLYKMVIRRKTSLRRICAEVGFLYAIIISP